ncbi:hypothetical protein BKH43_07030 [Helicobacter sp. 13S00401-1]|uniref:ankyrin repeat domain-containing protein n=1 Tax=Helicobacter sp. 13S00401-1 TaxID=1905758 RepID=UPI000BA61CAC|nr:ankyrin repeat domain-containing protein [Helicobacter sp. 13S00401-1]PAF49328.1 hypothetical protein BKH43_07030 [Helicobacter sp. 13S00401-1]
MIKTLLTLTTFFISNLLFAAQSEGYSGSNIFEAIKKRDVNMVKGILKTKPNLEIKNNKGQTPLMQAVYEKDNEIAFLLVDAGASVNTQDDILNSPFLYAGAEGNLDFVKKALKHGARFDIYNRFGGTALIPAAEKGHLDIVKLLVNTPNFPKDHINKLGWTALLEAVILSDGDKVHTDIVQALVDGGVDVNIKDKDGISALQHARNKNYTGMIKILEKAGVK